MPCAAQRTEPTSPRGAKPASSKSRHRGREMKHAITVAVAAVLFAAAPATAEEVDHLQQAVELAKSIEHEARIMMSQVPPRLPNAPSRRQGCGGSRGCGDSRNGRNGHRPLPPVHPGPAKRQRESSVTPLGSANRDDRRGRVGAPPHCSLGANSPRLPQGGEVALDPDELCWRCRTPFREASGFSTPHDHVAWLGLVHDVAVVSGAFDVRQLRQRRSARQGLDDEAVGSVGLPAVRAPDVSRHAAVDAHGVERYPDRAALVPRHMEVGRILVERRAVQDPPPPPLPSGTVDAEPSRRGSMA